MKTPSPALVVSLVALVVALGGSGYAIAKLPKNSVGSAQIKEGAVTPAKIRKGSLTADLFAPGVLVAGAKGEKGEAGAAGAAGATGATGATGAQGLAGSARAYASVSAAGSLSRAKNVLAANKVTPGVYCVQLDPSIDVATAVAVVGSEHLLNSTSAASDQSTHIEPSMTGPGCPGVNSMVVYTFYRNGSGDLIVADQPFYVAVP